MNRNPKEYRRCAKATFTAEFFFEVLKGEHRLEKGTLPDKFRIIDQICDDATKTFSIVIESDELPEAYMGSPPPMLQLALSMRRKMPEQLEVM